MNKRLSEEHGVRKIGEWSEPSANWGEERGGPLPKPRTARYAHRFFFLFLRVSVCVLYPLLSNLVPRGRKEYIKPRRISTGPVVQRVDTERSADNFVTVVAFYAMDSDLHTWIDE